MEILVIAGFGGTVVEKFSNKSKSNPDVGEPG
jgi:hypothetical protein